MYLSALVPVSRSWILQLQCDFTLTCVYEYTLCCGVVRAFQSLLTSSPRRESKAAGRDNLTIEQLISLSHSLSSPLPILFPNPQTGFSLYLIPLILISASLSLSHYLSIYLSMCHCIASSEHFIKVLLMAHSSPCSPA